MTKLKEQVQIKICDDNIDTIIAILHNILLAPDLCDSIFSIIMLLHLGNTCLFYKGFFTVYFGAKEKNKVILLHSAQRKHEFLGKREEISKTKKLSSRKGFGCYPRFVIRNR